MVQREVEVLQKLSDAHKVIEELQAEKGGIEEELIRNRMEKTGTVKRYEEKIKKMCETLKLQSDQEKDLRHVIDSLRKQTEALEDEKENVIQEGSKVVESLNMELEVQSRREMELKEQLGFFEDEINQLRNELDDRAKREAELREEKSLEIQKIRLENDSMSESLRTKISEMNGELMKHITKENDLRVQVESARVEKEKLLLELEELNNDKSSSTRTSRKLISELRKSENELLEKIDELNLTVKTLEGEKRRISMEYNDYQSDILNITQTSRDANKRMHEDIKILRDNNNNLHAQLRELKLNESCLLRDKLEDREGELKNEIIELRSKISAAEDKRVRDKAEYKSRENSMVFEAKVANSKIEDLHIEKKDQEIKRLDRSSEELRAQILRLQQEKQQISDSLDGCKTFLSHRNAEVHILEGKLSDQEALLTTCKRHNVELTNLRNEMMTNSMILGSRLDLIRVRQIQERNAQELKDSKKPWDKNSSNRQYLENRGSNNITPNIQTSSYENSSTLTSTA
ncbi:myosin-J heavy chain-like [Actinia tenebrosa]|uniref:Myosin-J heavy chain-like n=1 Tax=Actinia tenebrosa TaxID=6105 RepID=A0A6P8IFH2_ACTTE|nr:myosin-J heavy chain-like [Actinia tenebrosa]